MTVADGHPWIAALYDPVTWIAEQTRFRPYRQELAQNLSGNILDIGAGTGAMFPYVDPLANSAAYYAIEPDPHMRARARKRAKQLDFSVDIRDARAEALPFDDATFDVVLASLVFCTIPDPEQAIAEITRVLKPGGEFRFFEHVVDTGWRNTLQSLLSPVWKRAAGGCHLTRRTQQTFLAADGLEVIELERRLDGITPVRPFIHGRMYRTS